MLRSFSRICHTKRPEARIFSSSAMFLRTIMLGPRFSAFSGSALYQRVHPSNQAFNPPRDHLRRSVRALHVKAGIACLPQEFEHRRGLALIGPQSLTHDL